MSERARKYYMHTIDGKPALFEDRGPGESQLVYADVAEWPRDRVRARPLLRLTLNQIRAEQEASRAYRERFFHDGDRAKYGYTIVEVPE